MNKRRKKGYSGCGCTSGKTRTSLAGHRSREVKGAPSSKRCLWTWRGTCARRSLRYKMVKYLQLGGLVSLGWPITFQFRAANLAVNRAHERVGLPEIRCDIWGHPKRVALPRSYLGSAKISRLAFSLGCSIFCSKEAMGDFSFLSVHWPCRLAETFSIRLIRFSFGPKYHWHKYYYFSS